MDLVAVDIGGTHARFALASIAGDGAIALGEPVVLRTGDYADFEAAWDAFARSAGAPLPRGAAIAAAGPLMGGSIKLTNAPWNVDPRRLGAAFGLEAITVLNDFAAVGHAAASVAADQLVAICGPDGPLPANGTITVIGPGTGLGVAHVHHGPWGYHVQATEGGHVGFAPQDAVDDAILASLRTRYPRVVTEHVVAGPGITAIYRALGGAASRGDAAIWTDGIAGGDDIAVEAVERFCASLGSVAGDYALAHGAGAVVLAGGIGLRLRDTLPRSAFAARFRAKPRYETLMESIPVKLIVHPQPGLYGAAAAFAREHS